MDEPRLMLIVEELKQQLKAQAEEIATLRYERDLARANAKSLLPFATPEQEAEFVRLTKTAVPGGLADLIRELEKSEGGP